MDRNYLKGRLGDRINAVLAAAGYNFGLLLRWLAELLRAIIRAALVVRFFPEVCLTRRMVASSVLVNPLAMASLRSAKGARKI